MATRSKYGPRVEYSGPFFTKDVKKTFRQNARVMLKEIADDGEQLVKSELAAHRGAEAPHIADHIQGRVKSLTGKPWQLTSVVSSTLHLLLPGHKGYAQFLEDGRRGRGGIQSSFGGYFIFRRVGTAIKRTSRVARADLTRGLN